MTDISNVDRPDTGGWIPPVVETPPVLVWPPKPGAFVKYIFGWGGYLFPYNAFYMLVAVGIWWFLIPDLHQMKTLEVRWVANLLIQNFVILLVWTSFWHVRLYVRRSQGVKFKYNARWPKDTETFLFGRQLFDNMFWTLFSGVPLWTAYEVVTFWAMANGYIPYLDMAAHPVYFGMCMFLVSFWRETHFYVVHRLMHSSVLYKLAHSVHHRNSNPTPWSGLSMHPIEHVIYYSSVLIQWVIYSNPLLVVYHLVHLNFAPAPDHSAFGRIVVNGKVEIDLATYMHYLHHRYFEVNYGGDGSVPFDRWFGTWHNGTAEAHAAMNERFKKKRPPSS